ncbi:MAG TPA: ribonuclease III [Patescibacteria group bacterium]|nr:ribonuclease III [Patescibacteria group bacterium]
MDIEAYHLFAKEKLEIDFNDINLLITAFTHRSYLNEHRKTVKQHNERLEFLGDAVLELVVTEYLYNHYKDPEGTLTNWRSSLVRTESISAAAEKMGFTDYLRLSRGEKRGTARARSQILANSFEAVIGAIYLDKGYSEAKNFIDKTILSTFQNILDSGTWMDAKSYLQEITQSKEAATPIYKVLEESGPDHDKTFIVGVYVSGKLKGKGTGPNKQSAQQQAAKTALDKYKK